MRFIISNCFFDITWERYPCEGGETGMLGSQVRLFLWRLYLSWEFGWTLGKEEKT